MAQKKWLDKIYKTQEATVRSVQTSGLHLILMQLHANEIIQWLSVETTSITICTRI